ncbi:MAG: hypothetical protein ABS944_13830 [Solibacillus sp.]|jgi:hypothetical protein|uniref:hypothetical protein n=1 Tax=unclassified Solibacillus TaxID=2637870 RepID=UPI0030F7834C
MGKYTVIVTTHENRRLHYRTSSAHFIKSLYKCGTSALPIHNVLNLSLDELTVVEAYLDKPRSCEVIDNYTKKSISLPI